MRALADAVGEATVRDIVDDLSRRRQVLDEREHFLNNQAEELALAQADLNVFNDIRHRLTHLDQERQQLAADVDAWTEAKQKDIAFVTELEPEQRKQQLEAQAAMIAKMKELVGQHSQYAFRGGRLKF